MLHSLSDIKVNIMFKCRIKVSVCVRPVWVIIIILLAIFFSGLFDA
jgi:hypothetical protein